ncbi:MAG: hypothetical protein FJW86_12195 [Actinobacteria bacterium]|nr:hypothetical protein [Actinomycetota bacterium]
MSPSRAPSRGYRAPRQRLEVVFAVLGVAVVVLIAAALIWVLAPEDPEDVELPEFPPAPTETTLPGATTTLPGATTLPTGVTTTSTPG